MRNSLLCLAFLFTSVICHSQAKPPTIINEDGIQAASLVSEGIDSVIINKLTSEIKKGTYPNIHSLLIARHNKLVYEHYFNGRDLLHGRPETINFTKDDLHDVRSISKTVVAACIGIAVQQGKIKNLDQKIFDYFPEYASLDTGTKSTITIRHLLTMTAGLEWQEDSSYASLKNSAVKMAIEKKKIQYVLTRQMEYTPGTTWDYNGGATELLGVILERATGQKLNKFVSEFLFQPLGIQKFEWPYWGEGIPASSWGLRLRPRDMLKLGILFMNKGKWNKQQILPSSWVEESLRSHISRDTAGGGYGYQLWTWSANIEGELFNIVVATGNGDQNIFMDLTHDLLIVSTAGNYDRDDIEKDFDAMVSEYIYPALFARDER